MKRKVAQREELIDQITDLDVLRARLKAAERACVLFGWNAMPGRHARGRLAYAAWSDWTKLAGDKAGYPEVDQAINAEVRREEARDRSFRENP